jgi:hypothetical protein
MESVSHGLRKEKVGRRSQKEKKEKKHSCMVCESWSASDGIG